MLAVQKSKTHSGKSIPNILPCRLNHDGATDISPRHWAPSPKLDGKQTSYFRGRKLLGQNLPVPEGYRGAVLASTDRILPQDANLSPEDEILEIGVVEESAEFDEIILWGHETLPDGANDPYIKGVNEWIQFAEQIHTCPEDEKDVETKGKK